MVKFMQMIEHPLTLKLNEIPSLPGCYLYKDDSGKILYVGKARILSNRVRSYFSNFHELTPKIQHMLFNATNIETITVDTEIEALILEANLIKKYHPPYNTMLMDDKKYAWIKITMQDEFPAIYKVREKQEDGARYFGPYPSGEARDKVLNFLRKQFPYRSCRLEISSIQRPKRSRICMFYHINLCGGPCDGLITKKQYRSNILNIVRFLSGKKKMLYENLEKQMRNYSMEENYEEASKIRDQLKYLKYFMQNVRVGYGDDEQVVHKSNQISGTDGINELMKALLKRGVEVPLTSGMRIECYDISNISGKFPVGSMVVFKNGIKSSSNYRRFKVRSMDTPNDYKMMMEVLGRRLKYISSTPDVNKKNTSFCEKPSLIIIDGGKGQLSSAKKVIDEMGLDIKVVGLAKRIEEIWLPDDPKPILFGDNSQAKFLIQRVRDEAHRFAITYHRLIRSKGMFEKKDEKLVTKLQKERHWREFLKK